MPKWLALNKRQWSTNWRQWSTNGDNGGGGGALIGDSGVGGGDNGGKNDEFWSDFESLSAPLFLQLFLQQDFSMSLRLLHKKCSTMSLDHPGKISEFISMSLGRKCCWTSYRSSFPVLLLQKIGLII